MYRDAHNHLHDPRLMPHRSVIFEELKKLGVQYCVDNGTHEGDWQAVAALAKTHPWILPSFGLHPWFIAERSAHWRDSLLRQLDAHPRASIGEIGLDRWIEPHDLPAQIEVFQSQLDIAVERQLPVSIHCLKAWGPLWDIMRNRRLPDPGFLLHSYAGPVELVNGFVRLGGFFSFSGHFLHPRKNRRREVFKQVPLNRLLVETDAPDMLPPKERNLHPLQSEDREINHPANIEVAYTGLAETLRIDLPVLASQVRENFNQLFGAR